MNASFLDGPGASSKDFSLQLLGPPTVAWKNLVLTVPRRTVRALLYRLASDPEQVSRAHLQFLFWPEASEGVARRNLTHHLTHLRLALPLLPIQTDNNSWIQLDASQVWCDVIKLRSGCSQEALTTHQLLSLANLYRGPFLDGFDLPRHPGYEYWCLVERRVLERQYLCVLERLVERLMDCHEVCLALQYAQRYLATDPLSEAMHRRLIKLYAAAGERHLALQQFDLCSALLKYELGIGPMPETIEVYTAIQRGDNPFLDQPFIPSTDP